MNNYKAMCRKENSLEKRERNTMLCTQDRLWRQTEGGSDPG